MDNDVQTNVNDQGNENESAPLEAQITPGKENESVPLETHETSGESSTPHLTDKDSTADTTTENDPEASTKDQSSGSEENLQPTHITEQANNVTTEPSEEPAEPAKEVSQERLQDAFLRSLDSLTEGKIISGTVVQASAEDVFVDIGYKAEGRIALSEFDEPPKIGSTIPIVLLRKEIRNGGVLVSYAKAKKKIALKNIKDAYQNQQSIPGTVTSYQDTDGGYTGYTVELENKLTAHCPLSQIDIHMPDNPKKFIGLQADFAIDRLYREGKLDILLSRRHWLKIERNAKQRQFFSTHSVGDIVKGTVKHFVSFGAFVDLGGFDALLHVNDISWNFVNKPKEKLKKGQVIHAKIITLDPETKRIGLSLRHLQPNPWDTFEAKYSIGQIVEGKVTKLIRKAFFIEIEPGIEGLVHISELSWAKHAPWLPDVVQPGDVIKTKILDYNLEEKKVTLGVKQTRKNPWLTVQDRYPVGMRLRAPVVKVTSLGLFLRLEEDVDAFLHVKDISWTEHVETSTYMPGDELECVVVDIDPVNYNIRVSRREALENPWDELIAKYQLGDIIEGTISVITSFGLLVKTEFGIEGLVHKSQLLESKSLSDFTVGDDIRVKILEILPDKNQLSLSERLDEKVYHAKYMQDNNKEDHAVSMSDFM